ncbi:MAG TPA: glycosyltransferase [Polyangiaceae bacterium]|nr:glycosyltransferase [Polyangiaceae bacterium]
MNGAPRTFAILTSEYPPGAGGIGDFVALLAARLASGGDRVLVHTARPSEPARTEGVDVRVLPDDFGPETRAVLARDWAALPSDAVIFAQYVPQGFGWKGMNLPFARFLGERRERVWLMLHEVVYPFAPRQSVKLDVLAAATRLMLHVASRHAERAFVSTPAWEPWVERYARRGLGCEWFPIPATAVASADFERPEPAPVPTIAHFGTYGALVAEPLERVVVPLLAADAARELVLVGRGSEEFRAALASRHPEVSARVRATGPLDPQGIARELTRAWVTVFPFLEGVTTRRTSLMTALAAGAVIVTTSESCTESVWRRSGAVALVDGCRPDAIAAAVETLLGDAGRRAELARRARILYRERFELERAVHRLRELYDAPRASVRG